MSTMNGTGGDGAGTKDVIRTFLAGNFLLTSDRFPYGDDASLLDEGVVDSTGVLELVLFLEEKLGVRVVDADIIPENFDSVNRIAAYVSRQTSAAQPPAL